MYAVIDVGGKQIKVAPDEVVRVPSVDSEVGASVTFDRVIALRREADFLIGSPVVEGARVVGTVVGHDKADKVMIGKYRRRKYYRRKRGHRQPYTEVRISEIVV